MNLRALYDLSPHRRKQITKTLLIVKFTAIILLSTCLQVSASGYAQSISLSEKNAPLETVMKKIEQQTGYTFFYKIETIEKAKKVTVEVSNATLEQVLKICFKNQELSYNIVDKTIVVEEKKQESKSTNLIPLGDIHGHVTDSTGALLEGASVTVKGAKGKGTTTNAKGEFDLKNVDDQATLIISYTGYVNKEIRLDGSTDILVVLIHGTSQLDQVQVIAYGTTTQRLRTGDVTTVTSKEIEEQPVSNPLEALEGRVPGLVITQSTGLPGGAISVQLRGLNSIANGNIPFFVIDGVPYNSQASTPPLNAYLYGGSPLNFINPYDIESIEVLKDADATAIYGSRAANGAILITTKKGKAGNMKFDLNLFSGLTSPASTIPVLNTAQYLAMRREAFANDDQMPGPGDHDVNGDWDSTRNDNWLNVLANKPAQFTNGQASVSGGNTTTQYSIGAGYSIQRTGFPRILPGDGGDKKSSVHLNINSFSPDERFKLRITGSYLVDKNTVQSQDLTNTALGLPPDAPGIFNSDGSLNWAPLVQGQTGTWTNPYAYLYNKYVSNSSNLVGNAVISYEFIKGLNLKTSLGYTNTQTDEVQFAPSTSYDPGRHITSGSSSFLTSNTHSWILEPDLDYILHIGKGTITALTGASFLDNSTSATTTDATGFISDALLANPITASSVYVNANSSQYKYEAIFGKLNYNWTDKYLLNITGRRDGTSRFGPGRQFGNFGAVGAAWIFTNEAIVQKNLSFLSFGKLRGSYGTTGSDQIANYQYLDLYSGTQYAYQNSAGLAPQNLSNSLLAWETTKKIEGGLELGLFKDRVVAQVSIYMNRSGNELVETPVSVVTGFSMVLSNLPALVQNTGKEFVLNTINIRSKNFGWSTSFNLTISQNKLVSYPNLSSSPYANTLVVGQPINVRILFHCMGVNDTTGLYEFASSKGGPTYSPNSLTDLNSYVNPNPKFYGAISNTFSYRGLSVDIFFQFVNQIGMRAWDAYGLLPGTMFNQPTYVLNRWQKPGDKKPYEQFTQNYGSNAANAFNTAQQSDLAYGNASFIRLKNLAISYQMPQNWVKKMRLANFRIYVQSQNLLTITKYEAFDPESQSPNTGPRRTATAGIQIGW